MCNIKLYIQYIYIQLVKNKRMLLEVMIFFEEVYVIGYYYF